MGVTWEADALVATRSENVDRYKRNFLRQAVCELRFPTLMELGGARPPTSFVAAIRKEYPNLELANEVTLGIGGGSTTPNHAHIFRSAKHTWNVSLKQSSFSIETTAYTGYAQMKERALRVIEAASKIIDSDFFTRVAIRYINVLDKDDDPTDGWVNSDLVNPIRSGQFTGIHEYAGKIQLTADDGGCLLQHGIRLRKLNGESRASSEYLLDIDTYRNEVNVGDAEAALDAVHIQAFNMFDWALGPKGRGYLCAETVSTRG